VNRFVVFRLAIVLLFCVLSSRLWDLQMTQGQQLADEATALTRQTVFERPLRGEIFASDGTTVLAESLPAYTIAIRPNQLPDEDERQMLFARLNDMLLMTATLTLSPTDELRYVPGLREGIESISGPLPENVLDTPVFTATVPVSRSVDALKLTEQFTQTLRYRSPIATLVATTDVPRYQTLAISTTRSLDLARTVKENAVSLPGVVVERDYQRNYPHSAEIRSLSHLLGYIGPADKCAIMANNPPRYWKDSLYFAADMEECGLTDADLAALNGDLRYLLSDRIGRDGVERSYEDVLRGDLGEYQMDVDVYQRQVSERRALRQTASGENLVLSIDYNLQKKTEEILRKWIAEAERRRATFPAPAKGKPDPKTYPPIEAGVAIALEVNTGRVLSMVSWPSFDNNIFNRRRTQDEVQPLYNGKYPQAINRNIAGLFPPGSTWKQISGSAALANGTIGPNTTVHDPGRLLVKNQYFEDDPTKDQVFPNSFGGDRGYIDIREALRMSSNVFFESVMGGTRFVRNLPDNEKIDGLDPSAEKLAEMARAYGFGKPTGIPLPGEYSGVVPSKSWKAELETSLAREPWSIGDTYNFAIGQGHLLVTPLQLAVASAAVANGGTLYQPQLVRSFTDETGQTVAEVEPEVTGQVPVAPEHLQAIREGMRLSVLTGPNVCARPDISGLEIAGKTGTAEYPEAIDPAKLEYDPDNIRIRSHSWFVGFAPYDNPQIEVLVLIEGSGDLYDGSATLTVPAVTEIMQAYFDTTPPQASLEPIKDYKQACH
jgi:penicillin-binding protein 2